MKVGGARLPSRSGVTAVAAARTVKLARPKVLGNWVLGEGNEADEDITASFYL